MDSKTTLQPVFNGEFFWSVKCLTCFFNRLYSGRDKRSQVIP